MIANVTFEARVTVTIFSYEVLSLWRNWLARQAGNRKVSGSKPPGNARVIFL